MYVIVRNFSDNRRVLLLTKLMDEASCDSHTTSTSTTTKPAKSSWVTTFGGISNSTKFCQDRLLAKVEIEAPLIFTADQAYSQSQNGFHKSTVIYNVT